jgi:hypothetical protein
VKEHYFISQRFWWKKSNGRNSLWRSTEDPRTIRYCKGERGVKESSFLIISSEEVGPIDSIQRGSSDLS